MQFILYFCCILNCGHILECNILQVQFIRYLLNLKWWLRWQVIDWSTNTAQWTWLTDTKFRSSSLIGQYIFLKVVVDVPLHPWFLFWISARLWITIVQIFSATAPLLMCYFLIEANVLCSFPLSFITQGNKWGCARSWVGRVNPWVLMSTHLMTWRWHLQWALIGDIQINNHSRNQRCVNCIREDWEALSCVQHPLETNSHFHLCRVN